jgi:hypothetical protein
MTENQDRGAILIAEVGSVTTRVTLVDRVDDEPRLLGHAETASTLEPPYQNALYGILEAATRLSEFTGRTLLREGQLLMPQNNERDGIDHLLVVTSAAGTMDVVITAIASDVSALSALRASRVTYTNPLQTVTLDDAAAQSSSNDDRSWIERQVEKLLGLNPDVIIIAGGLEEGAVGAVNRLAHIVGLTALRSQVDAEGQQRQDLRARPVIYAGNSAAREQVLAALSDRAEPHIVDNVRPSLEIERLDPVRQKLLHLYETTVLRRLPGMGALQRLCQKPVQPVCNINGMLTRFVAERYQRRVLHVDIGSSSSSAFLAMPGVYVPTVLGNCGTGYGLSMLLAERGPATIARWLPFAISDDELMHRLLNKLIRPQVLPTRREDVYIDQALAREALAMLAAELQSGQWESSYDLLIAGGGVMAHAPHPGMVALMILDALQPGLASHADGDTAQLALNIHLDSLGLVPVCGALAAIDQISAVNIFDRDAMRNVPLATVVVAVGEGKYGEDAVEVELARIGGRAQQVTVRHGQIARLPLPQGARGQLRLKPASEVRVGNSGPGVEVLSDAGAIGGSLLGVIIDARGRPLALPEEPQERYNRIWQWLVALGAERGANPYIENAEQPDVPQISAGQMPAAAMPMAAAPSAPADAALANGSSAPLEARRPAAASEPLPPAEPAATPEPPPAPAPAPAATPPPEPVPGAEAERLADALPVAEVQATEEQPKGRRVSLSDLAADDPAEGAPESEQPAPQKGKRISLSDLAAEESDRPAEQPAENAENDLAKLRQSVEEKPKRGWFGRKQ